MRRITASRQTIDPSRGRSAPPQPRSWTEGFLHRLILELAATVVEARSDATTSNLGKLRSSGLCPLAAIVGVRAGAGAEAALAALQVAEGRATFLTGVPRMELAWARPSKGGAQRFFACR